MPEARLVWRPRRRICLLQCTEYGPARMGVFQSPSPPPLSLSHAAIPEVTVTKVTPDGVSRGIRVEGTTVADDSPAGIQGRRNMPRDEVLAASEMQVIVRERMEIPAPEDITIDHAAGVAFVSSQRRRDEKTGKIWLRPEDQPGGALFALDLSGEQVAKRLLTDHDALGFPFHPWGISLFCGQNGERRLLVINHRGSDDHAVEAFDVEGGRLRHAGTVRDPEHLIGPNDLVALDGDRFYVTNDHGARRALLQLLESGAALPWSTVAFYDGSHFHTVAKRIVHANGIALDHARRRLYVAAVRSKQIYDYAWDAD